MKNNPVYNTYVNFGYHILQEYSKKNNNITKAIDWLVKNTPNARWDVVERSLKIMEEGIKNKPPTPYSDEFTRIMKKYMQQTFETDMIYYTINNDGFRL